MANVDPMTIIQMIKNGSNPQQLMMSYLENQLSNTPMKKNLVTLAKNNQTDQIEQIARNIFAQRGLDFDTEFNAFKKKLGL